MEATYSHIVIPSGISIADVDKDQNHTNYAYQIILGISSTCLIELEKCLKIADNNCIRNTAHLQHAINHLKLFMTENQNGHKKCIEIDSNLVSHCMDFHYDAKNSELGNNYKLPLLSSQASPRLQVVPKSPGHLRTSPKSSRSNSPKQLSPSTPHKSDTNESNDDIIHARTPSPKRKLNDTDFSQTNSLKNQSLKKMMKFETTPTPRRNHFQAFTVPNYLPYQLNPNEMFATLQPNNPYSFNYTQDQLHDARQHTKSTPLKLSDFEVKAVLGVGTYGRVHLCRYRLDYSFYCLKILRRHTVFRQKQVEHINNEKMVLSNVKHPGIVKLFGTTNDVENLYLLLEYLPGGELFTYIRKFGKLPIHVVKIFTAELTLVLEYLHSRSIIYRDLKPENILLDKDGHLKLIDFGFAKYVVDRTWTMCGTPEYLAPEIISGRGHGKAVDWWSLGVLIFEMLAGYPPFTEERDNLGLFTKIFKPEALVYPDFFTHEAVDLIRRLLEVDPTRRIGVMHSGVMDIKMHPFFIGVNWKEIAERSQPGPLKINLKSPDDTSNYDTSDTIDIMRDVGEQEIQIPADIQQLFDSF